MGWRRNSMFTLKVVIMLSRTKGCALGWCLTDIPNQSWVMPGTRGPAYNLNSPHPGSFGFLNWPYEVDLILLTSPVLPCMWSSRSIKGMLSFLWLNSSTVVYRCVRFGCKDNSNYSGFSFFEFPTCCNRANISLLHWYLYCIHCFRQILPEKPLLAIKWIKYQCWAATGTADVTILFVNSAHQQELCEKLAMSFPSLINRALISTLINTSTTSRQSRHPVI